MFGMPKSFSEKFDTNTYCFENAVIMRDFTNRWLKICKSKEISSRNENSIYANIFQQLSGSANNKKLSITLTPSQIKVISIDIENNLEFIELLAEFIPNFDQTIFRKK